MEDEYELERPSDRELHAAVGAGVLTGVALSRGDKLNGALLGGGAGFLVALGLDAIRDS